MSGERPTSDAKKLEQLWSGDFGDAYVDRNQAAAESRAPFWGEILQATRPRRVLEVGCNIGANLTWIAQSVPPGDVYGIDVNAKALNQLRRRLDVNAIHSVARELPFRDRWFDLTF